MQRNSFARLEEILTLSTIIFLTSASGFCLLFFVDLEDDISIASIQIVLPRKTRFGILVHNVNLLFRVRIVHEMTPLEHPHWP